MPRVDDVTVRTLLDFEPGALINMVGIGLTIDPTSVFFFSPGVVTGPQWFGAINLIGNFTVLAGGGEWRYDADLRLQTGSTQFVDAGASIKVESAANIDFKDGSSLIHRLNSTVTAVAGSIRNLFGLVNIIGPAGYLDFFSGSILALGAGCAFNAGPLSTVNLDGTTDVDGALTITNGAFLFVASGATLTAQSGSIVSLLSGARIPKRHLSINTSPAASIVGKDYDFVLISAGTGPATYTIDDTLAATGDFISFVTTSATQPATIKDPGGGTLAILLNSAPGDKIRIDVMRVGVTWTVISTYYL